MHGRETNKLDDDKASDREEDAPSLAETVVEDLGDWLVDWAGENLRGVALQNLLMFCQQNKARVTYHAEAEDDVEEETSKICEEHSH